MSDTEKQIALPKECSIYEVALWQQKIIEQWPNQSTHLVFNLEAVQEMDASFVQLFLSCQKTAHHHGGNCCLINIPENVEERLKQMQVYDVLVASEAEGAPING